MLITNPGSDIPTNSGNGWTNTPETARREAERWLRIMQDEGMADIELLDTCEPHDNRWRFVFRHTVTSTEVTLETHGVDDPAAYADEHLFIPRVYWNGSSSAGPHLDDFAAPGYTPVKTYKPAPENTTETPTPNHKPSTDEWVESSHG